MPKLPRNMPAYRAELAMSVAMNSLDGKNTNIPAGVSLDRWVMYLLCSAVQDVAKAIEQITPGENR